MSTQGIAQIVFYAVVLTALGYPLGVYMSRIYEAERRPGRPLPRRDRAPLPAARRRARPRGLRADLEGLRQDRADLHGRLLRRALRAAARPGAPVPESGRDEGRALAAPLNTAASFVTNTNWQFYGGEATMSYLSQMAGLAVQNFVSAAVGMAVLAAVIRGFARRNVEHASATSGATSTARSSTSCCRCHRAGARARLAGRRADVRRPHDRDDARGRPSDDHARARRLPDRDQAARHERRRLLRLELGRAVREPERPHELPRDARDPAHPGRRRSSCSGRMVRAMRQAVGDLRGHVRADGRRHRHRASGRAARLAGAAAVRRQSRPDAAERRQHAGQGGALRHRQQRPLGGRDDRRLQRLRQLAATMPTRPPAARCRSSTSSSAR